MSNRQVIAIFISGVAFLLVAFWAGLSVSRDKTTADARPAQAAAVSAQPQEGETRYTVYVATFGTLEKAKQLEAELHRRNYLSAYTQSPNGQDTLYRVNIGPYTSRADAQKVANELAIEGYKGLMIIQI